MLCSIRSRRTPALFTSTSTAPKADRASSCPDVAPSENAEYHAGKDQQGLQEARVRQLRQMIENAEIIEARDDGIIKPGTIVTIRYQGDDEPESYFYGLREEKQGGYDVVTPDSPLGRVLLGRTAGETVTATVPAGELKVDIEDVRVPA